MLEISSNSRLRVAWIAALTVAALMVSEHTWANGFLPEGVGFETVPSDPRVISLGAESVACIAVTTSRTAADMSEKIVLAHNRIYYFAKENELKLGRGALEISARYQELDGSWFTDACRSLQAPPREDFPHSLDIRIYEVPAGRAVQALHRGDHGTIDQTIESVEAYIACHRLRRVGPLIEYHFNHKSPEEVDQQISVVSVYVE